MMKQKIIDLLTLLSSASTLVCCAIPALLVSLGLGATLAGVVSAFPQLVWLSEHKLLVFVVGGLFIMIGGIWQHIQKNAPCPIDVKEKEACTRTRQNSYRLYNVSLIFYLIGFFFAFIAPKIL